MVTFWPEIIFLTVIDTPWISLLLRLVTVHTGCLVLSGDPRILHRVWVNVNWCSACRPGLVSDLLLSSQRSNSGCLVTLDKPGRGTQHASTSTWDFFWMKININPSNAETTFIQSTRMQLFWKNIYTLSCCYSLDSSRWVRSDEYPYAMD